MAGKAVARKHPHADQANADDDDMFDVSEEALTKAVMDQMNSTAQSQLKTVIERIERLEEDKAGVVADLKEVYAEAKGNGFDSKIIRKVVRLRKMDPAKRQEEEALVDLYLSTIGDL